MTVEEGVGFWPSNTPPNKGELLAYRDAFFTRQDIEVGSLLVVRGWWIVGRGPGRSLARTLPSPTPRPLDPHHSLQFAAIKKIIVHYRAYRVLVYHQQVAAAFIIVKQARRYFFLKYDKDYNLFKRYYHELVMSRMRAVMRIHAMVANWRARKAKRASIIIQTYYRGYRQLCGERGDRPYLFHPTNPPAHHATAPSTHRSFLPRPPIQCSRP